MVMGFIRPGSIQRKVEKFKGRNKIKVESLKLKAVRGSMVRSSMGKRSERPWIV